MNFQFQTFFNATISSCNCLIFNGPTDFDFENCELNMGKCLNQGYIIRAPNMDSLRMNFPVPKITSLTYRNILILIYLVVFEIKQLDAYTYIKRGLLTLLSP